MFDSFHDFVLRLSFGIRREPPAGTEYPPFFPDTAATRQGIWLVRIATLLLAAYGVLHKVALWPAATGVAKLGWVSCAFVGLALMAIGVFRAIRARL
jgi:hypothetical protein